MALLDLPNELLFAITLHLNQKDLEALVRTSWGYYRCLNTTLYKNDVRKHRSYALCWAAVHDSEATARLSLTNGGDVHSTHARYFYFGACSCVGGPTPRTPLEWAVIYGSLSTFKLLLECNADPIVRVIYDSSYYIENCCSMLHIAACHQSVPMVELLLKKGLRGNVKDSRDRSPLHWMVGSRCKRPRSKESQYGAILNLLISDGANPLASDDSGMTPLLYALDRNQDDTNSNYRKEPLATVA